MAEMDKNGTGWLLWIRMDRMTGVVKDGYERDGTAGSDADQ